MRLLLFFFLFQSSLVSASSQKDLFLKNLSEKIDTEFNQGIGGAAAIIYKGKVVYKKTFGKEYIGGPSITEHTYFPFASVTKSFTALIVADLIQNKKLSLNTKLREAIPRAPHSIQIYNLLSHSSGLKFKGTDLIEKGESRKVLIEKIPNDSIRNSDFLYNNLAFSLIENIVEHATKQSWSTVFYQGLKQRGLNHVRLADIEEKLPLARPHFVKNRKTPKTISVLPKHYPITLASSAGAFGSINDLIAFAQLQLSSEFDELHRPRIKADDIFYWNLTLPDKISNIKASYGLGWRILEVKNKETATRFVYHGGLLNGVSAFVGLVKSEDLAIVMLRNDDLVTSTRMGISLWAKYLGRDLKQEKI